MPHPLPVTTPTSINYHVSPITVVSTSSQERLAEIRRASLAAELHFMYTSETTKTEELFSPEAKVQMGLGEFWWLFSGY